MQEEFALPMSFAQQRLWFLDRFTPNSAFYNISRASHLTGALEINVLEASLNAIVTRHEALRTRFEMVDEQPVQIIVPSLVLSFEVTDLSGLPVEVRDGEIHRLLAEEAGRPFDLERGPLLRVQLLRLGSEEHVLLLTIHHIISDGWSMGVLMRELSALYRAFVAGLASPLEALPIQYADYAVWQREWLQGEELSRQLGYWTAQLEGLVPLQLPTDRPRPVEQSFQGAGVYFTLPHALTEDLKSLSRREGVTLFMTLLAAFQLLLSRYSGQDNIAVGSPIAGRNRSEIEKLIGFFVNTLVLRTDLSGDPTFKALLERVREVSLDAYDHQDLPFEKLVEELQPKRDPGRNPLYEVMFVLQNAPGTALKLGNVTAQQITVDRNVAKNDLTLELIETQDGLRGLIEYNKEMFDAVTISRMSRHFKKLLNSIVAEPERCIHEFSLLTEAEQHQLLMEWNDTAVEYPRETCAHRAFETWVARTPEAIAVVFEDQQLTYHELNTRANQLAHHLQSLGTGPEVLVAICLERSLEMVVGILGILKAGGAYVPLDPSYPKERLGFMLSDTGAPVLLTQQGLQAQLPAYGGEVLCLDRDWPRLESESRDNPPSQVTPDDLAYVMYTSGSTGKPKGVEVCHRSVARLVFGVDYVRLDRHQTLLLLAPISFDASTFELWGALLHGARCVVYPERVPTFDKLREVIQAHKVTTLWLTASLFNAVIDEDAGILGGVSQVLTGGEALSPIHIRRALERLPQTQLVNGYGPTESTTFTCCYRIPRKLADYAMSISIGRPIANTQVYVLDDHLYPVPVGVPGELYIGGDGLARGYLNRPELTAEKFIQHPFSEGPEARLYRTGDRVRYLPDGNIEFLGRVDHQIKLRGFRIEPGEIVAVLGEHPEVRQTVVLVREDMPGDKRLVAYVVARDKRGSSVEALRAHLKQRLPEYMVPSAFVLLEQLPLTPNGKVDREELPIPEGARPDLEEDFVAPRTPVEEVIADLWQEVLGVERIGIHDNFFDLGGHSLMVTQVVARLRRVLEVDLSLRTVFESPTIAKLAVAVDAATSVGQERSIEAIPVIHRGTIRAGANPESRGNSRAKYAADDKTGGS